MSAFSGSSSSCTWPLSSCTSSYSSTSFSATPATTTTSTQASASLASSSNSSSSPPDTNSNTNSSTDTDTNTNAAKSASIGFVGGPTSVPSSSSQIVIPSITTPGDSFASERPSLPVSSTIPTASNSSISNLTGASSFGSASSTTGQPNNVTSASVIPQTSIALQTTNGSPLTASSNHKSSTSVIAGGIIGGLLFLLLATLLFRYRRRLVKRLGRTSLPWRKSTHTAPSAEFMNHPVVLAQRRSSSALLRATSPFPYGNTGAATAPPLGKYPYADSYDGHTLDEAPPPFTMGKFSDPIMEKVSASAAVHQRMFSADNKAYYEHGAGGTSTLVDHEVGSPEEMSEVGHAV
ncbi:hypothetical protein EIP86_011576 [Pleurotus ostreatoroseus]|nr:hypothetical protein EIP86_011576 [Pleurotus ostreatoroseus]